MTHDYEPQDTSGRKLALAARLRSVRLELYGEHGGPVISERLGLPFRTWANYESGVTVPGIVLLEFVALTGVEPLWLLRGRGPQCRATPNEAASVSG